MSMRRPQLLQLVPGQVEQRVDVGHAQRVRAASGADDLVAGGDVALGQDAQVEPRTVVGDQQRRELRLPHPHPHPEAGDARLGDLELRLTDPVAITDADLVVAESLDGEVLPERAVLQVVASEELLPVPVGLDLVDEYGALLAAVPGQVTLPVAVDVQAADQARPVTGLFQTPVCTVRPRHDTSFGIPTLTDSSVAIASHLLRSVGASSVGARVVLGEARRTHSSESGRDSLDQPPGDGWHPTCRDRTATASPSRAVLEHHALVTRERPRTRLTIVDAGCNQDRARPTSPQI